MNLVGSTAKAKASGWVSSFMTCSRNSTEVARRHGDVALRRALPNRSRPPARQNRRAWLGRRSGIAALTSTTARRSGSAVNPECQIDSISQSWSVLSGAGDARAFSHGHGSGGPAPRPPRPRLVQLLDPPFDKSELNPGYIKGYVPGVRENGGQYTHAAIWAAMAFARLGDNGAPGRALT